MTTPLAAALTLTWQPAYGYVDFVATGVPAGNTIFRRDVIDPTVLVSMVGYADGAWLSGGAGIGQDYRVPIGETVTYVLAPIGSTVDSPGFTHVSVAIPGNQSWLRDVSNPNLSMQVIVVTTGTETRANRQNIYQVAGRTLPLVVHDLRQGRTGSVTILCPNRTVRYNLDRLLNTGNPLLLNVCNDLLWTPCYMAVGDAQYSRISTKDSWTLDLDYTEVDEPTSNYSGGSSTRAVWSKYTPNTWQQVKDTHPTWLETALGTP